jgi:hypothetical protein
MASSMSHFDSKPGRDSSEYPDVQAINDLRDAEQALRERERLLNSLMGVLPGSAYRALPTSTGARCSSVVTAPKG